jgi:hypothetical protein
MPARVKRVPARVILLAGGILCFVDPDLLVQYGWLRTMSVET